MKKKSQSNRTTFSIAVVAGVALLMSLTNLILVVYTMNFIDDEIVTRANRTEDNINLLVDCQAGSQKACDFLTKDPDTQAEPDKD